MAVTQSGLYVQTFLGALGATQLALDLDADTHKVALFNNSITPNFDTNTAYGVAPYNANEVTGTGWPAGGITLTGTTLQASTGGIITFDANDVSQPSTTISGARCAQIYADALAGNNAIVLVNFGADYSTTNGTFTIQWNAGGIFQVDLVFP